MLSKKYEECLSEHSCFWNALSSTVVQSLSLELEIKHLGSRHNSTHFHYLSFHKS